MVRKGGEDVRRQAIGRGGECSNSEGRGET